MKKGFIFIFALITLLLGSVCTNAQVSVPNGTQESSIMPAVSTNVVITPYVVLPAIDLINTDVNSTIVANEYCYCGYRYSNGTYCAKRMPCYLGSYCETHGWIIDRSDTKADNTLLARLDIKMTTLTEDYCGCGWKFQDGTYCNKKTRICGLYCDLHNRDL